MLVVLNIQVRFEVISVREILFVIIIAQPVLYICNTRFSFYKNILYKNIEDEMGQKVKNILRICSSWTFAYKVKNTLS